MMKLVIIDEDDSSRAQLGVVLQRSGLSSEEVLLQDSVENENVENIYFFIGQRLSKPLFVHDNNCFERPLRLGSLLERIQRMNFGGSKDKLIIGSFELDCISGVLVDQKNGAEIRLTDKEKHILEYLYAVDGEIVVRQDLLNAVWGYAQGVETHTLETHMYRLRQKIEADPSVPKILITEENGYRLVY